MPNSSTYPMHEANAARFMHKVRINVADKFPSLKLRYLFNDTVVRLQDIQSHHERTVSNLELPESEHFAVQDLIKSVLEVRARMIEIIEESKTKTLVIVGFDFDKGHKVHEMVLDEVKKYILQEAEKLNGVLELEGEFRKDDCMESDLKYFHMVFK